VGGVCLTWGGAGCRVCADDGGGLSVDASGDASGDADETRDLI
jgi:hypothetical protein